MSNQGDAEKTVEVARRWSMPHTSPILRPRPDHLKGYMHFQTAGEHDAFLAKELRGLSDTEAKARLLELQERRLVMPTPYLRSRGLAVPSFIRPAAPEVRATYYFTVPMSCLEMRAFSLGMYKYESSKTLRRLAMFLFFAETSFCSTTEGGHRNDVFEYYGTPFKRTRMYMEYVLPEDHNLPEDESLPVTNSDQRRVYKGHLRMENVLGVRFVLKVYDPTLLEDEISNPYKNFIFHLNPPSGKARRRTHEEEVNNDAPAPKTVTDFIKRFTDGPSKKSDELNPLFIFEQNERMKTTERLLKLLDPDSHHKSNTLPRMDQPGGFDSAFAFSNEDMVGVCEEQRTENKATGDDFRFSFPEMTFEIRGHLLDALTLFTQTLPYSTPYMRVPAFPKMNRADLDDPSYKVRLIELKSIKVEVDYVKLARERVYEHLHLIESKHKHEDKYALARALKKGRVDALRSVFPVFTEEVTTNTTLDSLKAHGRSETFRFVQDDITVSSSLTHFGNFMAYFYERFHVDLKDDCNHDITFLVTLSLFNILRFHFGLKLNLCIQGAPSTGKSHSFGLVRDHIAVPDTTTDLTGVSKKGFSSSTPVHSRLYLSDEVPPSMKSAEGDADATMKTALSENKISTTSCGSADQDRKEIVNKADKMISILFATNVKLKSIGTDLQARFRIIHLPFRMTEYSAKADRENKKTDMQITPFARQLQMLVGVVEIMIFAGNVLEVDTSITKSFFDKTRRYYLEKAMGVDVVDNRDEKRLYMTARTLTLMYAVYMYVYHIRRDYFATNPDPFSLETLKVLQGIEPYLYATEEISVTAMSYYTHLFVDSDYLNVLLLVLKRYDKHLLRDAQGGLVETDGYYNTTNPHMPLSDKIDIDGVMNAVVGLQPAKNKYYNLAIYDILDKMHRTKINNLPMFQIGANGGTPYLQLNATVVRSYFAYRPENPDTDADNTELTWFLKRDPADIFMDALQSNVAHKGSTLTENTITGLTFDIQAPYVLHTVNMRPVGHDYVLTNRLNRVEDKTARRLADLEIVRGAHETGGDYLDRLLEFNESLTPEIAKELLVKHDAYDEALEDDSDYFVNDGTVCHELGGERYTLTKGIEHFTKTDRRLRAGWAEQEVPPVPQRDLCVAGDFYPLTRVELCRRNIYASVPEYRLAPPASVISFERKLALYKKRVMNIFRTADTPETKRANLMDTDSDNEFMLVAEDVEQKEGLAEN